MTATETVELPKQHKACIYDAPGKISTKIETLDVPEPGPGEVLIHLGLIIMIIVTGTNIADQSGGCVSQDPFGRVPFGFGDYGEFRMSSILSFLCSSYMVLLYGVSSRLIGSVLVLLFEQWATLPHPTQPGQVGGHEGVGEIVKLGPGSERGALKVGDRVGVKWVSGTCGSCPQCLEGVDALCSSAKVSGYYTPGTFQQYCLGPANYVTPIPKGLSSAEAAPMLCAGVTTYAALRRSNAKSGQWVVIAGAGGGLGHIAVQLASRGMAQRVIGIDAGPKEKLVKDCGAEHFIDLTKHDDKSIAKEVLKLTGGLGASAVIVCTASNNAYAQSLDFLRFGGTMVCVGIPEGASEPIARSYPQALVFKQATIAAVAVGNRRDAIECLDFAARGIVKTHFRTEKMEKLTEVFQEMKEGKLIGRVVIDLQ